VGVKVKSDAGFTTSESQTFDKSSYSGLYNSKVYNAFAPDRQVRHSEQASQYLLPGVSVSGSSFWNTSIAATQPSNAARASTQDLSGSYVLQSHLLHASTHPSGILQQTQSQHETHHLQDALISRLGFLQQYANTTTLLPALLPRTAMNFFDGCATHSLPPTSATPSHFPFPFPPPPPADILQLLRRP
jgi:hypothetical protein